MNRYLCDAVAATFPDAGGGTFVYPAEAHDLANWRFVSLYHGLETQDAVGTASALRRGAAAATIQVANLDVVKHVTRPIVPLCP